MTIVTHSQFFDVLKNLLSSTQILNYKPNMDEAIVFDLDGTIIFDHTWDSPITPVIDFINYCSNHNIKIIIITARPGYKTNIDNTRISLEKLSIACDKFFFKNPEFKDVKMFKVNARDYVTKNLKLNILMSIGDNNWDMGQFGGLGILMKADKQKISYNLIN